MNEPDFNPWRKLAEHMSGGEGELNDQEMLDLLFRDQARIERELGQEGLAELLFGKPSSTSPPVQR